MAAHLADAILVDPCAAHEPAERPVAGFVGDDAEGNSSITVARSIIGDVLIALPFWALVAFVVYLVL